MINEIIAVASGYLLGSIPTAYIVSRRVTGKDIRRLGGGNVGGLNAYREVGALPALAVGLVDLGKGAAAVAIAYWLLGVSPLFVMLAGLAAVIGHNWMLFLKFSGGKGMGAAFGALLVLMPVYGYWYGFLIIIAVIIIPFVFTRNVALSMGIGLLFLPLITWLITQSGLATILAVTLGVLIGIKFLPTARTAWSRDKNARAFIFDDGKPHQGPGE
ncbi:MAG: glycerol-3-phosphate acyltransferase [Chloroflexota bacterium]|nr:glycerol-3-phosphate acyltransferase [Chloroflexota bacterium]